MNVIFQSEKLTPHEVDVCSKPTTATSDVGTQNEDGTRAEQGAKECFTVQNLEGATDELGSIESTATLTVSEIASTGRFLYAHHLTDVLYGMELFVCQYIGLHVCT